MKERNYSAVFRIMHWAIALCMFGILFTIFLRLNWMNKNHMANILLEELNALKITLSEDDAISIAKKIRKPMWQWHIWLGYVMIGLYVLRMIFAVVKKMAFLNPFEKGLTVKQKFQAWLYVSFYLFIGVTLFTGFMIVNGSDALHETMEEIHKLSLYYILTFVFIHITGIIAAELGAERGIISKIISGNKGK